MSNSNSDGYPFRFRVTQYNSDRISEESTITVYDGWDKFVCEENGEVNRELPIGLYVLRVERGGEMRERVIRHGKKTDETMVEPLRYSSMPAFDTATTHEYYAYTSQNLSSQNTCPAIGNVSANSPRLFLFIRAISNDVYEGNDLGADLALLDINGKRLMSFDEQHTQQDKTDGWLALSAPIEPGFYILQFNGKPARHLPIIINFRWDLQVFITFKHKLLFETASILMSHKGQAYNPDDRVAQAFDAALQGLQNNRNYLPREMMNTLLQGKFDNAMLGLLGLHLILRRDKPNKNTVDIVLGNLANLLPDSPDVRALELMASAKFDLPFPDTVFGVPPMLRAGLNAVITAGINAPNLIPEGSIVDRIAPHLYTDSPWASWSPIPFEQPEDISFAINADQGTKSVSAEKSDQPEWIKEYLTDTLESVNHNKQQLNTRQIAFDLNLPVSTVDRYIRQL